MTTIVYNPKKMLYNKDTKTFYISGKDVRFDTTYEIKSPKTGNSKKFDFTSSTGSEWDPKTQWIYKSPDGLTLIVGNQDVTKEKKQSYLNHKLGLESLEPKTYMKKDQLRKIVLEALNINEDRLEGETYKVDPKKGEVIAYLSGKNSEMFTKFGKKYKELEKTAEEIAKLKQTLTTMKSAADQAEGEHKAELKAAIQSIFDAAEQAELLRVETASAIYTLSRKTEANEDKIEKVPSTDFKKAWDALYAMMADQNKGVVSIMNKVLGEATEIKDIVKKGAERKLMPIKFKNEGKEVVKEGILDTIKSFTSSIMNLVSGAKANLNKINKYIDKLPGDQNEAKDYGLAGSVIVKNAHGEDIRVPRRGYTAVLGTGNKVRYEKTSERMKGEGLVKEELEGNYYIVTYGKPGPGAPEEIVNVIDGFNSKQEAELYSKEHKMRGGSQVMSKDYFERITREPDYTNNLKRHVESKQIVKEEKLYDFWNTPENKNKTIYFYQKSVNEPYEWLIGTQTYNEFIDNNYWSIENTAGNEQEAEQIAKSLASKNNGFYAGKEGKAMFESKQYPELKKLIKVIAEVLKEESVYSVGPMVRGSVPGDLYFTKVSNDEYVANLNKDKYRIYRAGSAFILQINGVNKNRGTLAVMKAMANDYSAGRLKVTQSESLKEAKELSGYKPVSDKSTKEDKGKGDNTTEKVIKDTEKANVKNAKNDIKEPEGKVVFDDKFKEKFPQDTKVKFKTEIDNIELTGRIVAIDPCCVTIVDDTEKRMQHKISKPGSIKKIKEEKKEIKEAMSQFNTLTNKREKLAFDNSTPSVLDDKVDEIYNLNKQRTECIERHNNTIRNITDPEKRKIITKNHEAFLKDIDDKIKKAEKILDSAVKEIEGK